MLETHIRPLYQRIFVDPVAKKLAGCASPNAVSIASLAVGLLAALMVGLSAPWVAVLLLLLSGWLDTLDGTIARLTDNCTSFGTMLDITCDRMVEFAIILGLFAIAPEARGWLCMGMLGSVLIVITTFLTAGMFLPNDGEKEAPSASKGAAESSGFAPHSEREKNRIVKSFNYTPALMERPEAFTLFILMMFLPEYFNWLAALFIILVMYTAGLRMWQTKKILGNQ